MMSWHRPARRSSRSAALTPSGCGCAPESRQRTPANAALRIFLLPGSGPYRVCDSAPAARRSVRKKAGILRPAAEAKHRERLRKMSS